jgi:hypothetical protein
MRRSGGSPVIQRSVQRATVFLVPGYQLAAVASMAALRAVAGPAIGYAGL